MSTNKPFFKDTLTPPTPRDSDFSHTQPFDMPTQPAGLEGFISTQNVDLDAIQKALENEPKQKPAA